MPSGGIRDYEGEDRLKRPTAPHIAINTTAGTGSELTRFAVITDPDRQTKMAVIDRRAAWLRSYCPPMSACKLVQALDCLVWRAAACLSGC